MSEQPCVDCARLHLDRPGQSTRYCPSDDQYRCRAHRTAHLDKLGIGKPVRQPPSSVGQQGAFL